MCMSVMSERSNKLSFHLHLINCQLAYTVSVFVCVWFHGCWFWNIPAHHNGPKVHTRARPDLSVTWKGDSVIGTSSDRVCIFRSETQSSSPLQTDAEGRGWKWGSLMTPSYPSPSSGVSKAFINLENERRFITSVAFVPYSIFTAFCITAVSP